MRTAQYRGNRRRSDTGSTLIELLIAMLVLAIGLGGVTTLLTTAIVSNNRNSRDTTATLLGQKVIEQVMAQNPNAGIVVFLTDCSGTQHDFSTDPGAAGTGNGAHLNSDGTIDFTQAFSAVPDGYAMQYVDCSAAGGIQTTYDVRWNVMSVSTNNTLRMVTVAAKPMASQANQLGGFFYAAPVNLRSIGGPNIGE